MNTLTAQDVLDIRDRYAAWEHPADLAQHYGVSTSVIYGIAQGRLWADVTGGKPLPRRTRPDPNLRMNAQHVRPLQARPRTTGTGVGTRDPQTPRRVKPRVKLTAQDVLDIQDRHAAGEGTVALARRYAVSNQTIYSILRGHTWGRVTGIQPQKPQQPQKPNLTANAALDIYTRYAAGESSTVLAREYQVSRMTVNNIVRGEHWGAVTGGVSLIKNGSMPNARLTPETVRQLRERARQGGPVPLATLAAEYGVSPSAVGSILRWDTWKDATPDLPAPHLTHVRGRKPALNPSQRADIRQASQQGRTPADLAAEYGVHVSTIRRALKEVLQLKLVLNAPARYWSGNNMVVIAATPTSQLRLIADILDALPSALTVTVTLLDTQRPVSTLEMSPEDISLDGARAFVTVKHPPSIWDILPTDRRKTDRYQVILTVETL